MIPSQVLNAAWKAACKSAIKEDGISPLWGEDSYHPFHPQSGGGRTTFMQAVNGLQADGDTMRDIVEGNAGTRRTFDIERRFTVLFMAGALLAAMRASIRLDREHEEAMRLAHLSLARARKAFVSAGLGPDMGEDSVIALLESMKK